MGNAEKVYAEACLIPNKDKKGKILKTFKFSLIRLTKAQSW